MVSFADGPMPQAADLEGRESSCVYAQEAVVVGCRRAPLEEADARACTVVVRDLPMLVADHPSFHARWVGVHPLDQVVEHTDTAHHKGLIRRHPNAAEVEASHCDGDVHRRRAALRTVAWTGCVDSSSRRLS